MKKVKEKYGVYAIILDGFVRYIGSGNLSSRKSNHLARLRHNNHTKKLQDEFNKVGEDKFEFYVIDYCNEESLYILEDLHMMIHEDTIFNKDRVVQMNKKKKTKEEKIRASENLRKANMGENNPACKLTEEQVKEIIILKNNKIKHKDIAEIYCIKNVRYITNLGRTKWSHLNYLILN